VDAVLSVMAAAPERASQASQVKQELIVTRLAHRLGLRQETVWTRLGELRTDRRRREAGSYRAGPATSPAEVPPADGLPIGDLPPAKAGPVVALEMQLLGLLLATPWLVPRAAEGIAPAGISHSGLRRLLDELYSIQSAGLSPDMDSLRERLLDRPDLFEAAKRLHDIGHQVDREADARTEWLGVILRRFAELMVEAERRKLREQLEARSSDEDAAVELLRKLQQTSRSRGDGQRVAAAEGG
jgi:DNA primase